ncbi:hypothetical protein [Methylobacterium gregans]|uniref:hypothetical protein n=1 Tax=Methylobacterium gregans TaxID=374424 RepID=UPI001EE39295|nr:hypothetical protein [Methylobacterium gregans]MDQ0521324.1 hypothetical protein [Methylobacterium gregans]GLS54487.1 hypothetical protein GCM10007886_26700 [Methylobacterium gregans]
MHEIANNPLRHTAGFDRTLCRIALRQGCPAMSTPDLIQAAIAAARAASAAHIAACDGLGERDEAAMQRCNQAYDDAEAS